MNSRKEHKRERKRRMLLLQRYQQLYLTMVDDAVVGKAQYMIYASPLGLTYSVYRNNNTFLSLRDAPYHWDNKQTPCTAAEAREVIRSYFCEAHGLQPWHLDEMEKYRD